MTRVGIDPSVAGSLRMTKRVPYSFAMLKDDGSGRTSFVGSFDFANASLRMTGWGNPWLRLRSAVKCNTVNKKIATDKMSIAIFGAAEQT
jgi:hypothetical protein